jgi:hypothetical protein
MRALVHLAPAIGLLLISPLTVADVIVNYTVDLGGETSTPLSGLTARATFAVDGDTLTILLENRSTGVPGGFDTADSLLVSLGMNLVEGVDILAGDSALIGPGSQGLGAWSDRLAGESVAEEWIWTNDFGGDFLESYAHIISTSSGQGGGSVTRFDGGGGSVSGPYGGIAADPPIFVIPDNQRAVSDSIFFELTLSSSLTPEQLDTVAYGSVVEFGSDQRYLGVPEPASAAGMILLAGLLLAPRRR